MPSIFQVFSQVGRVAYFTNGPLVGKPVTIVDLVDQNRALVDGPGVRMIASYNDLALTKVVVEGLARGAASDAVAKAVAAQKIQEKFNALPSSKRFAQLTRRSNLNDFERHKVRVLKTKRNRIVRKAFLAEKKADFDKNIKPKQEKAKVQARKTAMHKTIKTRLAFARLVKKKAAKAKAAKEQKA